MQSSKHVSLAFASFLEEPCIELMAYHIAYVKYDVTASIRLAL